MNETFITETVSVVTLSEGIWVRNKASSDEPEQFLFVVDPDYAVKDIFGVVQDFMGDEDIPHHVVFTVDPSGGSMLSIQCPTAMLDRASKAIWALQSYLLLAAPSAAYTGIEA